MTSRTTLFLGDLSLFCTEKDIYRVFKPFGEIVEVKIMKSDSAKKNLSYGFITFGTFMEARSAMSAMNGFLFCGRRLRVSWAAYSNRKEPKPEHYERMNSSSVHFSYISHQLQDLITEESLRRLFSNYGEVLDTSLKKSLVNQTVGRQCGYGFVHFARSESGIKSALAAAKALKEVILDGVYFKCSISHNLEKHLVDGYLQNLLSTSPEAKHHQSAKPSAPVSELAPLPRLLHVSQSPVVNHKPLLPPTLPANQFMDQMKENIPNPSSVQLTPISVSSGIDLDDFSLFGNNFDSDSSYLDHRPSIISKLDASFERVADTSFQTNWDSPHMDISVNRSGDYFDSLDFSFMD